MKTKLKHKPQRRSAFTLIELIAVIAIIAILLSLILPVLSGVIGRGDEVAVSAEITQLDQALTAFKAKFGVYPPSSLIIPAQGDPWDAKSRASVKSIWPQFDFTTNGGSANTGVIELSGAECLVFFLGGVEGGSVGNATLSGFSKNPLTPWTPSGNPDGPFMEFDLSRLVDVDGAEFSGAPIVFEYVDPMPDQSSPIMYVSASNGRYNKTTDSGTHDDYDVFGDDDTRNMLGCYMQADGLTPQKQDSFQLISAGEDGLYGEGGAFSSGDDLSGSRHVEADNITNFSGGTLN